MSAATLIPFPTRRIRSIAERLLTSSATPEMLSRPIPRWSNRPPLSEPLGNMLQRLALLRPYAILTIEAVVADMLAQLEADDANGGGR